MNYWPLLGVLVVVVGFVCRWNPIAVVVGAALTSGIAAGKPIPEVLALLGESFVSQRSLSLVFLTLPVIGVLEWAGLREQARDWIGRFAQLNLTRLLVGYLGARQLLSMLGLTTIAGHAQTVRPLLAPMSEAAVEKSVGAIAAPARQRVLAMAAATDNVGLFFGEDVFLAFGGVLLIQGFLAEHGLKFEPLQIALWALPTAIAAFAIHAIRVWRFEQRLRAAAIDSDGGARAAP
jgi:uncharacterized membrane protein